MKERDQVNLRDRGDISKIWDMEVYVLPTDILFYLFYFSALYYI